MNGGAGWKPLSTVAELGGLLLDWQCWQVPGEDRAAEADLQVLMATLAQAPVAPAWAGVLPQARTAPAAIGLPCRLWPRSQGRFVYAAARLRVAEPLALAIRLGAYAGYRLWLDGDLLAQARSGPAFEIDDNRALAQCSPGQHHLLVEIDRAQWETVFHVRVSSPDDLDLPAATVEVDATVKEAAGSAPPTGPTGDIPPAFSFYNDQLNRPGRYSLDRVAKGAWASWHADFSREYRRLLAVPVSAPLVATVGARVPWHGVWLERVVLQGGPSGPIPLYCLLPSAPAGPSPAILCIHGHGLGKDDVVGISAEDPAEAERVSETNYSYGLQLAQRGYAVFAPDLRAFGERRDVGARRPGRDECDNDFMKASLLGVTPLALNLADLQLVVGYALGRPEVDAARFGCLGLSLGGRMSMYLAALDDRIGAVVVSGALNTLKERLTSYAACGSQLLPGLWRYGDTPELFGLIAPRPLLLELGTQDGTSPELFAVQAYRRIRHAYALAGAEERLDVDVFASGHRFSGRKALPFLDRWLDASAP